VLTSMSPALIRLADLGVDVTLGRISLIGVRLRPLRRP